MQVKIVYFCLILLKHDINTNYTWISFVVHITNYIFKYFVSMNDLRAKPPFLRFIKFYIFLSNMMILDDNNAAQFRKLLFKLVITEAIFIQIIK